MVKMKIINIQIQPNKIRKIKVEQMIKLFSEFASKSEKVSDIYINKGYDNGEYINISYLVSDLKGVWSEIKRKILNRRNIGFLLKEGIIIACEGQHSWKDYLLLHHFDKSHKLDSL